MTLASDSALADEASAVTGVDAVPYLDRYPRFVARWELDLSGVQPIIEAVAKGAPYPPAWVETLLQGVRISDLDERAAQAVGAAVTREEMVGQPVALFAPPDSWLTLAELIVAVATDRPAHAECSRPVNSFMLRDAILKVWGAAGEATSDKVNVVVEGIVDDDRSPWAVRASEQRYRRLIHHLPNALLQVDGRALDTVFQKLRAEGVVDLAPYFEGHDELIETALNAVRVTDANDAAVRLFRADRVASLIGPVNFLFLMSEEGAKRGIIAHFEGRRSHSELIKVRAMDGQMLDVQLSVTFPRLPERLDVTLVSLEDVTDRLRTETQLRQLQSDYSRATRIATLGELASSIAHEVNQPLAAIAMNADTSLRWLSRDQPNLPKVAQLNERIAASARHASDIVQRIRGMAARQAPERLPVDLNEIVEEALLFVRHDIEAKTIKLTTDFAAGIPPVRGDRVQLQQVIVNLLVNSIQALTQMRSSGGLIELSTGTDEDGATFFAIRDNGPGVAAENLDRVFEGFFTTKDDGMGIGLSVCHSTIIAHGGKISAGNQPTGGAEFRFSLPALTETAPL